MQDFKSKMHEAALNYAELDPEYPWCPPEYDAFVAGVEWCRKSLERSDLFKSGTTDHEVFAIKKSESGEEGAYIGYRLPNGDFHFETVPYTGPELVYSRDYEAITGFRNHETRAAYEEGREHEAKTYHKFIEEWDGSTNSGLGKLLHDKFKELCIQY